MHQTRTLHKCGCDLFQRTRDPLRRLSKRVRLFLIKEVWPERNANRAFAIKQPADPHRAAQLLENCGRERLVCYEQVGPRQSPSPRKTSFLVAGVFRASLPHCGSLLTTRAALNSPL